MSVLHVSKKAVLKGWPCCFIFIVFRGKCLKVSVHSRPRTFSGLVIFSSQSNTKVFEMCDGTHDTLQNIRGSVNLNGKYTTTVNDGDILL